MYIMFIVNSWPAFCHAANKRRLRLLMMMFPEINLINLILP